MTVARLNVPSFMRKNNIYLFSPVSRNPLTCSTLMSSGFPKAKSPHALEVSRNHLKRQRKFPARRASRHQNTSRLSSRRMKLKDRSRSTRIFFGGPANNCKQKTQQLSVTSPSPNVNVDRRIRNGHQPRLPLAPPSRRPPSSCPPQASIMEGRFLSLPPQATAI